MKRTFLGTVTAIKTDGVMGSADIDMKAHGSMHTSSYTIRETEDLALAFAKRDAVRITVETGPIDKGKCKYKPDCDGEGHYCAPQDHNSDIRRPGGVAKARLDADGTAEPLTRIVHHPPKDACQGPGMLLHNPEYEAADGKRIPLACDSDKCVAHSKAERTPLSYRLTLDNSNKLVVLNRIKAAIDRLREGKTRRGLQLTYNAIAESGNNICDICGRPSTDIDVISDEVDACACAHCRKLDMHMRQMASYSINEVPASVVYDVKLAWQAFIKRPR